MKKTILFGILLILFNNILNAQEITFEEAKSIAIDFFQKINEKEGNLKSSNLIQVDSLTTYYIETESNLKSNSNEIIPAFYILNRKETPGFVIVSANFKINNIIAYSTSNSFSKNVNPGTSMLLDLYVTQTKLLLQNNLQSIPNIEYETIEPGSWLLEDIEWDQGPEPYNSFCPENTNSIYPNSRVPAGCGATALAQILYYYKYPRTVEGRGYDYKYELMLEQPQVGIPNDEISQLIFDCAIAQEMNFGAKASSSLIWNIRNAIESNFNYKDLEYHTYNIIDDFYTWDNRLKNEIDNKRPILYKATDLSILGTHFFVVDGYDDFDRFHVNWGWGGDENGFYLLDLLNPFDGKYTFEFLHEVLIGIEPANPDILPPFVGALAYSLKTNSNLSIKFSEPINPESLNTNTILIQGSKSGIIQYNLTYYKETFQCVIDPINDFKSEETISITLTQGITDLVGNGLDGDEDGNEGPNYELQYVVGGFENDYSAEIIPPTNTSPLVGDNVIIKAKIANKGTSNETQNATLILYDNGTEMDRTTTFSGLTAGDDDTYTFDTWTATEGGHQFKVEVQLPGDENPDNNQDIYTLFVGNPGELLVEGQTNPVKNLTLSPGNTKKFTVLLQNTGGENLDINIIPSNNGNSSLFVGTNGIYQVNLSPDGTINDDKLFEIEVGCYNTGNPGDSYTGTVTFYYQGKNNVLTLNVDVVENTPGFYEDDLQAGAITIDGGASSTRSPYSLTSYQTFYIDGDPTSSDPEILTLHTVNLDQYDINHLVEAKWGFQSLESVGSSSATSVNFGIGTISSKRYSVNTYNEDYDFTTSLKNQNNKINLWLNSLYQNEKWKLVKPKIRYYFCEAAWGRQCEIDKGDLNDWDDGDGDPEIWFSVDNVYTKGTLHLFNNRSKIKSVDINGTGNYKFDISRSNLAEDNYFVIQGDYDNGTKVVLSDIRLEVKFFTGDPDLNCTKTLSKNTFNLNENITVNLQFENVGSNVAENAIFDESNLPDGLIFVSGEISDNNFTDVDPGESEETNYTIKATKAGSFVLPATNVVYEDPGNHEYQTTFNALNLKVIGGNILVTAETEKGSYENGDKVKILADVTEEVNNSVLQDAKVTCTIKNVSTNTTYDPLILVYDNTEGKFLGQFEETNSSGTYEITITAQRDGYADGTLLTPLQFEVVEEKYLEITPSSRNVAYNTTSTSFTVSSNVSWNILGEVDWITASKSGNDIIISLQQNSTQSIRSGIITITSDALPDKIVSIIQDGAPIPLIAGFFANVLKGEAPLTVNFFDQSTGNPTSWNWDFGDGATSEVKNPTHIYTTPGLYTVTLTVSNGTEEATVAKEDYIDVGENNPDQPNVELNLYRISDTSGTVNSANPGVSKTDFKPGETVRVTLMATNSGVSISPLCVLNIFDSIDDVVYDSHPVGEDNSSLQELSSQSGTGYFSFDWTIPQNAVLGNYNLGAVIRAQEDWETLYDETNVGANTTTFSNGWILQNKFSVSTDVQTDWNLFNVTDIGNGEHQMVAVRDQTEYAYIELEWDGKSDMHISFDLKTPTGFSYAEYIRFGLFKAGFHENFDYGSENVRWFHYGYADGQSAMKAKVTISEYGGFGMNPATNEWFTYSMDYDYSLQVLTAKFTDSSGNVVFSKSFENILFDFETNQRELGFFSIGMNSSYGNPSETIIFRNLQYSFTNDVVPTNTQVSSTTITSGSTDCFNATQTITVAGDGDVIVESGASANFIAGQNIRFLPGFHAQAGSYTHGYITTTGDYCVEAPPALVAVEQANTKEGVITVAGITEQAKKEMVVYPNPNNGEFTVEFRNFENEIRVMLFNSIGQLIRNLKTNEKQMRISLPNLESGMYYLKAVSNNQQFSQKIVVR